MVEWMWVKVSPTPRPVEGSNERDGVLARLAVTGRELDAPAARCCLMKAGRSSRAWLNSSSSLIRSCGQNVFRTARRSDHLDMRLISQMR